MKFRPSRLIGFSQNKEGWNFPSDEAWSEAFEMVHQRYKQLPQLEGDKLARSDFLAAIDSLLQRTEGVPLGILSAFMKLEGGIIIAQSGSEFPIAPLVDIVTLIKAPTAQTDNVATADSYVSAAVDSIPMAFDALLIGLAGIPTVTRPGSRRDLLSVAARSTQVMVRNPAYPQMVRATLKGLFGAPDVRLPLARTLGFDPIDAIDWVWHLSCEEQPSVKDFAEFFRVALDERKQGDGGARRRFTTFRRRGPSRQTAPPSVSFLVSKVALRLSIEQDALRKVIDALALPAGQDSAEALDRFFSGQNPLARTPFVWGGGDEAMLPNDALTLPALKRLYEEELQRSGSMGPYATHRAKWVEDKAVELLQKCFAPQQLWTNVEYEYDKASQKTKGSRRRSLYAECDGLLVSDKIALILEVKSGSQSDWARAGKAGVQDVSLDRLVGHAGRQADRVRQMIRKSGRLKLRDGSMIDLSHIREVYSVLVSLETWSGFTRQLGTLSRTGFCKRIPRCGGFRSMTSK